MKKIISAEATSVKRGLLCAAAFAMLGAVGCASDADSQSVESAGDSADVQALQAPDSQTEVKDPKGAYIASITANGTGCPAGTWDVNLSGDGLTYTVTFSGFEAEVDRTKMVSVKDCNLLFKLHSPQGLSFTVDEFYYGGYMYLEDGVQLRQQATYYFQGAAGDQETVVTDTTGPQDKSFLIQDTREDLNFVKSRCGTDETLIVRPTLRLLNSSNPRRNGYANIAAVDGSRQLVFKLSWKRC